MAAEWIVKQLAHDDIPSDYRKQKAGKLIVTDVHVLNAVDDEYTDG